MDINSICNTYRRQLYDANYSVETVSYYPDELKKFLDFVKNKGKEKIDEININDVIEYRNELSNSYKSTIVRKKMHAIKTWIRMIFELNPSDSHFADLYNKISAIRTVMVRKDDKGGYEPIPFEHFIKILEKASNFDIETKLFIYLLFTTGGRSQFYGIKIGEIDFENKVLNIFVKGEKEARIPLLNTVMNVLVEHIIKKYKDEFDKLINRGIDKNEAVKIVVSKHKNDFLFKNGRDVYSKKLSWKELKKNREANTINAERILKRVCENTKLWVCNSCNRYGNSSNKCDICGGKVKYVSYTPHQVRKALARYGEKFGLSLEGLQDLLAHSQIDTTKKYYRGQQDEKVRKELEGLEKLIEKLSGTNPY